DSIGRRCCAVCTATRVPNGSCGADRMSCGWTAPISRGAATSTPLTRVLTHGEPQHRGGEAAHRPGGGLRGIGVPVACPAGQGRGGRVEADRGEHLAGGRFTHRPGEAGVRSPAGGAAGDVARIGLAQLGQRRPVVHLIVGAQRPQVPRPGVDLDWFHGSAGVERELVTTSSRSTPNDYLISASTVPWVMAAPASTARPV